MARLEGVGAWLSTPFSKQQASKYADARFARLHMLLGIKNSEDASTAKFKGRAVVGGDCVKTSSGEAASWSEVSSTPTELPTIRMVMADALSHSSLPQSADCIAAYVQAKLGPNQHIFINIPFQHWSSAMRAEALKAGFTAENAVGVWWKLVRPLYGLPDSGRQWAAHLDASLRKIN